MLCITRSFPYWPVSVYLIGNKTGITFLQPLVPKSGYIYTARDLVTCDSSNMKQWIQGKALLSDLARLFLGVRSYSLRKSNFGSELLYLEESRALPTMASLAGNLGEKQTLILSLFSFLVSGSKHLHKFPNSVCIYDF